MPPVSACSSSCEATTLESALAASRQVDKFVEAGYAKHGVKPNAMASGWTMMANLLRSTDGSSR